ncbi:MAG: hypothetical protein Q7V19_12235, partial [Bacteroidales bacterium]|nr:hypothetical protein [Bacteroidales bacterium]
LVDSTKSMVGVLGARMMGGGFGGCTINLVKTALVEEFCRKSAMAFMEKFSTEPAFYYVRPGEGAREIV